MKYFNYQFLLLIILFSCANETTKEKAFEPEILNGIEKIEINSENRLLMPEEFKAKMETYHNFHLVDVRSPKELEEFGTIEGSVNIDFTNANFEEEISKLNKGIPIFIFCRSGGRSKKVCAFLNEYGFEEVYDLEGGYDAWLENNKKL